MWAQVTGASRKLETDTLILAFRRGVTAVYLLKAV